MDNITETELLILFRKCNKTLYKCYQQKEDMGICFQY